MGMGETWEASPSQRILGRELRCRVLAAGHDYSIPFQSFFSNSDVRVLVHFMPLEHPIPPVASPKKRLQRCKSAASLEPDFTRKNTDGMDIGTLRCGNIITYTTVHHHDLGIFGQ